MFPILMQFVNLDKIITFVVLLDILIKESLISSFGICKIISVLETRVFLEHRKFIIAFL